MFRSLYSIFFLLVVISNLLVACLPTSKQEKKLPLAKGFYYWKTNFQWQPADSTYFEQVTANKLHIRLFDVGLTNNEILPQGVLQCKDTLPAHLRAVPVVYVTQEALKKLATLPADQIDTLAKRIVVKTNRCWQQGTSKPYAELQIDCDWTASNQATYFLFLKKIRQQLALHNSFLPLLSCTIRLYPMKYYQKMGVPPVDKGLLMCYNLENPMLLQTANAIFSHRTAKSYLAALPDYPLPLDVALPLFSWTAQFQEDKKFVRLLHAIRHQDLQNPIYFRRLETNYYQVIQTTVLQGVTLTAGNLLRVDEPLQTDLEATAQLLNEKLQEQKIANFPTSHRTILFFDYAHQSTQQDFAPDKIKNICKEFE